MNLKGCRMRQIGIASPALLRGRRASRRSVMAGARAAGIVQPALSRQIREPRTRSARRAGAPRTASRSRRPAPASCRTRPACSRRCRTAVSARSARGRPAGRVAARCVAELPAVARRRTVLRVSRRVPGREAVDRADAVGRTGECADARPARRRDHGVASGRGAAPVGRAAAERPLRARDARAAGRTLHRARTLADIANELLVWFDAQRSAAHHRFLMAQCQQAGFHAAHRAGGQRHSDVDRPAAAGMGCAFVPESASPTCPHTVRLVALSTNSRAASTSSSCSTVRRAPSPVVARFLEGRA